MSSYVPGAGVAVVGHGAAVLLPAEVEPRLAHEVHAALVPGVGVADVLQVLTGEFATSLARIPAFALAVLSGSGVQAVARGSFEVRAGDVVVSGEGVSTWTERFVAGVEDVALVALGAHEETEAWPLEGGIVHAGRVLLGAAVAHPPIAEAHPPIAEAAPAPAAVRAEEVPDGPGTPEVRPPTEETVLPSETVLPAETLLPGDEDDSFDHLWGSTVLRPVEQAAVRADEDEPEEEPPVSTSSPEPAPPPAAAPAGPPARAEAPVASPEPPSAAPEPGAPAGSGWKPPFVIEVPAAAATAPPAAPAPLGDHDGETVIRPSAAVVDPAPAPAAPGRVGRVRLSSGQVIELDRPVVLGRKPRVSRVAGAAVPRLVTVPSPEQDISRSHLEIRLEGVNVLVVDLGSTNGSTLLRTGQLPVRLHPHEAVLVVDGDVVDLGEGVTLTFEGLA